MNENLKDLYRKFDGVGGDLRLSYYGQMRAAGFDHRQGVFLTFLFFRGWCRTTWPSRGIEIPKW